MRYLLFDDDTYFLELLEEQVRLYMIKHDPESHFKVQKYYDVNDILSADDSLNADICFLDIAAPEHATAGLEIAKKVRRANPQAHIIFITNYAQYRTSVLSPEIRPSGYFDKPLDPEKLTVLLHSIFLLRQHNHAELYLHVGGSQYIRKSDIFYLERVGRKIQIHAQNASYLVNPALSTLSERLGKDFIWIDKGVIINRRHVKVYDLIKGTVQLPYDKTLYISQRRKKAVRQALEADAHVPSGEADVVYYKEQ